MAAGVGISYIVGPRLVQAIADAWGWRNGFRSIAAVGLIVLPFVYFWLRERRDSVSRAARIPETGYTLREAFKLPPFRFLAAAYLLMGLSNGAGLHLVPFLTADRRADPRSRRRHRTRPSLAWLHCWLGWPRA